MPKSLDQVNQEKQASKDEGKKYSPQDVEIAIRMGIKLLNEGNGLKLIKDAIDKSQDPGVVVGQFLAQLMGKMAEQLQKEANVDPGVFLAKDGFLENILDYIETKLGYPEDFSDQIYQEVLETIKAAAMNPPAPNNVMEQQPQPGEAQAQQAPMPQPPAQPGDGMPPMPQQPGGMM